MATQISPRTAREGKSQVWASLCTPFSPQNCEGCVPRFIVFVFITSFCSHFVDIYAFYRVTIVIFAG